MPRALSVNDTTVLKLAIFAVLDGYSETTPAEIVIMDVGIPTPPWPTDEAMETINRLRVDGQPVVRTHRTTSNGRTRYEFELPDGGNAPGRRGPDRMPGAGHTPETTAAVPSPPRRGNAEGRRARGGLPPGGHHQDRRTPEDGALNHDEIARRYPAAMKDTARCNARTTRERLLARGEPDEEGFVRFTYRPFDNRWLYWEQETKLLDEKRADYRPHVFKGNLWLSAAQHLRKGASEAQVYFTEHLGSHHLIERGSNLFPAWLLERGLGTGDSGAKRRANLSSAAHRYLKRLGAGVEDLLYHVLAVLHDPAYREANAGGLRLGWPRIPLPGWRAATEDHEDDVGSGDADALAASAARGRELANLLDPDAAVPGVTSGALRRTESVIGVPSTVDGTYMTKDDFAVTAGWGRLGQGRAVMPGAGRTVERD